MALLDMFDLEDLGPGVALGVGAVLLAPKALPVIGRVLKPVVKSTMKGGIVAYEKLKEMAAEVKESMEDMTAEVNSEMADAKGDVAKAVSKAKPKAAAATA